MTLDILYTSHNRSAFVEASFETLLANTDWSLVNTLHVFDDQSVDGTFAYLDKTLDSADIGQAEAVLLQRAFGGPVAAMNHCLDRTSSDTMAKIDSDVAVCPGWLEVMLGVLNDNPELDALGMEPGFAEPVQPISAPRTYIPASYIGGVGVFRTRVFDRKRPVQHDRYFGLTAHWRRYAKCGWVSPDLPMFLIDHLPGEPWASLAESYVDRGWSRAWPKYGPEFKDYFDWWLATDPARKMETAGT